MKPSRSLVLVTVDCLRADHVGFLGYGRPTTPFLDSLAKESFVLPTALVAGTPTYYSFPAILASRYPLAFGRDIVGLAPGEPTLATTLQQAGYTTGAFVAGNPYLSQCFGYNSGFHTFRDFLDSGTAVSHQERDAETSLRTRLNRGLTEVCHKLGPAGPIYDELYFQYCQHLASRPPDSPAAVQRYPTADVVIDHVQDWLASASEPFFLWVHLMDPHSPYCPPPEALESMGEGRWPLSSVRYLNSYWNRQDLSKRRLTHHREEILALYDAGIRWVDGQLARLVEVLHRFGIWQQCIFALTADHGEEFLEHGGRYHSPSKLAEELIRVPLLIRVPEVSNKPLSAEPFSLLHLAPTLLDAAGVSPAQQFQGRSHWPQIRESLSWDGPAIVECVGNCTNPFHGEDRVGPRILGAREVRYKLVMDFAAGREQLFDLEADPAELHPLPEHAEKSARRRLLEQVREHIATSWQDSRLLLGARLQNIRQAWAGSRMASHTATAPCNAQPVSVMNS